MEDIDQGDGFLAGGTRPSCVSIVPSSQPDDNTLSLFPAENATLRDSCPPEYDLVVQVDETITSRLVRAPFGWKVFDGDVLRVNMQGTWGGEIQDPTNAVAVLQLCDLGLSASCWPLVPNSFDESTAISESTDATPDGAAMEYVEISEQGQFEVALELKTAPKGTYAILAAIFVLDEEQNRIRGAFNIPAGDDDQLVTFLDGLVDDAATVTDPAVRWVLALSTVGGTILLYLLMQALLYRDAQVFELTQGKFIIAMLVCGLLATVSLVFFEPRNTVFCHVWQPMITLPLHIMYAIILGRMWRIRAVISPLLLLTLEKKEHWTTKWVNWVERWTRYHSDSGQRIKGPPTNSKKIRRRITDFQLMRVIMLLSLPQVVIQVLILVIQDQRWKVSFDDQGFEDTGIAKCEYRYFDDWMGILSFVFISVEFLLLLLLARASKDLPSLFNETQNILDISWVTMVLVAGGSMLYMATRYNENAPTVQYLVFSYVCGVTTVYTCCKITWPKLRVAWSGHEILVTKLIADHNFRKNQGNNDPYNMSTRPGGSFISDPSHTMFLPPPQVTPKIPSVKPTAEIPMELDNTLDKPNFALGEELQVTLEEDDEQSTGTSDSSVIMVEMEEDDEFPVDDTIDHNQALDPAFVSTPWQRVQSVVAQRLRFSRRSMAEGMSEHSERAADATAELPNSQMQSGVSLAPPSAPLPSFSGGNKQVLSRRAMFQHSPSTRSPADFNAARQSNSVVPNNNQPLRGPDRHGAAQSLVRPPGKRTTRSSIFGLGGRGGRQATNRRDSRVGFSIGPTLDTSNGHQSAVAGGGAPATIEYNPKLSDNKIRISDVEPPGRRLLLRMIDVQRMLSRVNTALLTGLPVDRHDWTEIRQSCVALGDAFSNEVEFEWEVERQDELQQSLTNLDNTEMEDSRKGHVSLLDNSTPRSGTAPPSPRKLGVARAPSAQIDRHAALRPREYLTDGPGRESTLERSPRKNAGLGRTKQLPTSGTTTVASDPSRLDESGSRKMQPGRLMKGITREPVAVVDTLDPKADKAEGPLAQSVEMHAPSRGIRSLPTLGSNFSVKLTGSDDDLPEDTEVGKTVNTPDGTVRPAGRENRGEHDVEQTQTSDPT